MNDPGPLMAHITGLVTSNGIGLIRCARCHRHVDAAGACVGTVVDGTIASSVLICPACGQDPDVRGWLVEHLTAPEAPDPRYDVA